MQVEHDMATLDHPRKHLWTHAEYYRMADDGYFEGRRVELIGGEILEMPPQGHKHIVVVHLAAKVISRAFGEGFWVRSESAMSLGDFDDPEPDIAVVRGAEIDYFNVPGNRIDPLLVAEVSDSTLSYDRREKKALYARFGIPEYWVINLVDRRLEVYRNPVSDSSGPRYADPLILARSESISPLAAPAGVVRVADLLP